MCNLYANKLPHEAMRQMFDVSSEGSDLGNMPALPAIYPKYEAPIVTCGDVGRRLTRSHWGFLTPKKSKKTGAWLKPSAWNNTRDDKIMTAPLWKESFANRRCLVPASAYAEATGRNPATYHWFAVKEAEGFAFAGIWKHQAGVIGETEIDTVVHSIVTTGPNEFTSDYHHRMPVILAAKDYDDWLLSDSETAFDMLRSYPATEMEIIGEGVGMREQPSAA